MDNNTRHYRIKGKYRFRFKYRSCFLPRGKGPKRWWNKYYNSEILQLNEEERSGGNNHKKNIKWRKSRPGSRNYFWKEEGLFRGNKKGKRHFGGNDAETRKNSIQMASVYLYSNHRLDYCYLRDYWKQ